jgi:hypothetical protein
VYSFVLYDLQNKEFCRIGPLLGKDLETNNETTAVAVQRRGKHAFTTELVLKTLLCNPLQDSGNSCDYNNKNGGVFYVVRAEIKAGAPQKQDRNCQTGLNIWS